MFKYCNINPEGKRVGDCVIRAISLALDIPYDEVLSILYTNSNYFNCDMLVRDCYSKVLSEDFGLPKFKGMGKTVREVIEDFNDSILIIRIENHLTASIGGVVYDIWDPSEEIVDVFWVVE